MKVSHPFLSGVLLPAICVVVSMPLLVVAAQSPVPVESRESVVAYQPPIEDESIPGSMENQYQLQLLQQEIMQLRGLVEQLQHEFSRLKSIQDDRYLELDARLQQALKANVSVSQPVLKDPAETAVSVIDENVGEKELYETIQILIRNRQYEMAITQLEALIGRFPKGEYTANAYYWLGQVHAAKTNPDFEKARQALAQVISYFPDHGKVPDAAYALGKVYHKLGDCERATDLLQQVIDQYPGKSAAKLAGSYLRESVNCDN